MTPERAEKLASNPAVKGNLSLDEIVKTDWEKHYKSKGIPIEQARKSVAVRAKQGQIVRLRNTLFLLPHASGDEDSLEFHTITADPKEMYVSLMFMFLLGVGGKTDIDYMYSYTDDKKAYKAFQPLLGEFIEFEPTEEEGKPKYTITFNVRQLFNKAQAAQRQRGGAQ